MRKTVFHLAEGRVEFAQSAVPPWGDTDDYGGVSAVLYRSPNGISNLHRIPAS